MTALPRCYSLPFNLYNRYSTFLFVHKGFKLCSGFEFHKRSGFKIEMLLFHNRSQNLSRNTGGPTSSCEMIILRNKIRGEVKRVCMGIFTTAPRNKKNTVKLPIFPYKLLKLHHDSYFARWSSHSWSLGCLWQKKEEVERNTRLPLVFLPTSWVL